MKNYLKNFTICLFLLAITLSYSKVYAEKKLSSSEVTINDINQKMTREEIIEEMVKDGISREDAQKSTQDRDISLKSGGYGSYYTTVDKTLDVTSNYKPTLRFYLKIESKLQE